MAPLRPLTWTGVTGVVCVPSPSWPSEFSPQLQTVPSCLIASEWYPPEVLMYLTLLRSLTGPGMLRDPPLVPLPSWFWSFAPQTKITLLPGPGVGLGVGVLVGVIVSVWVAVGVIVDVGVTVGVGQRLVSCAMLAGGFVTNEETAQDARRIRPSPPSPPSTIPEGMCMPRPTVTWPVAPVSAPTASRTDPPLPPPPPGDEPDCELLPSAAVFTAPFPVSRDINTRPPAP